MSNNQILTRILNAKARQSGIPLSGTFELTPVCNLSCKMCYVRKTPGEVASHDRPPLTLDQWKKIADEAFEAGMLFLLLTGGEPLLWPGFRELYEYLAQKGFVLSINSNGTSISDEIISLLRKYPPARINITLYGASDNTYERLCGAKGMHTRVVSNIDKLLSAGISVKLNSSMTPDNAGDMGEIIEFARQRELLLDVGTYMFPPIRRGSQITDGIERFTPEEAAFYTLEHKRLSQTPEAYRAYLWQAIRGTVPPPGLDESCIDPIDGAVRCQAGRASFWITWDGYMTPCGMMPQPKADIAKLGFRQSWQDTAESTKAIRLSSVCESCKNQFVCHSCASMALAETGTPSGIPEYLCRMAEAIRAMAKKRVHGSGQTD